MSTEELADHPEEGTQLVEDVQVSEDSPTSETETDLKEENGFQKRVHRLQAQAFEAQQTAQQAQAEKAEMERQLLEVQRQSTATQHGRSRPTLEQYNYDETAYSSALDQWHEDGLKLQQEEFERKQQATAEQSRRAQQQVSLQQRISESRAQHADFDRVVFDPTLPRIDQINPAAAEALFSSEHAGELAYYLAKNPVELYGLSSLDPLSAARKIGQIEAALTTRPTSHQTPPPPPTTVKSRGGPEVDPESLSTDEWMEWRNTQLR